MSLSFAEDIFVLFFKLVESGEMSIQHQDHAPIISFYTKILQQDQLTKNQADYVLKILGKYPQWRVWADLDPTAGVQDLKWKQPFRILDLTKKIYVERSTTGVLEVCVKFPYQLKKEFDEQINSYQLTSLHSNNWDADQKLRRLNLYDFNLIALYEFASRNQFDIDDSFMNVLADVEEIWQNQEQIIPCANITADSVMLENSNQDAEDWFSSHTCHQVDNDLVLAKSMGYVYSGKASTVIEKIAASPGNSFWMKSNKDFFDLYKTILGKAVVILDRTGDTLAWLQKFVTDAEMCGVDITDIKVCFRDTKERDTGINEWIKSAGVGGKVESGRLLIFEARPAKWLFKQDNDVTLLVTNNVYPPTNIMTKDWFQSHSCVIYLGDIKPSKLKGQRIVEL